MIAEFLRLRGNSQSIVVVRHILVREPGAQDYHHAPLLLLSRVLKIIVVRRCECQRFEQKLHARQ
jgi:hypothetical protein